MGDGIDDDLSRDTSHIRPIYLAMNLVQKWQSFQDRSLYYQAVKKDGEESFWREIARDYNQIVYPNHQQENLFSRLLPRLDGITTAIEIGAGPGSLTLPLAKRLREITAVEPSPAMAGVLEERLARQEAKNVTVVKRRWEEAELPPADAVLAGGCLYVFYEIETVLLKMLASARSKVLLTHIGNEGLLDIDRRFAEHFSLSLPCLFPPLSLVLEVLLALHIPTDIETFFLKTKKTFSAGQWLQRCQRLFSMTSQQHPLLINFMEHESRKEGDLYCVEEAIPAAIIEFRGEA